KFCTINLIIFLIYLNSMIIRGIGDFLSTQFLKETPMEVSILLLICIVIYGYRQGITNIGRSIEVFLPTMVILYLLGVVLVTPKSDFTKLLPLLENGVKPLLNGAFSIFNFPFTEMVILLMIIPFVSDQKNLKKPLLLGTLLGGAGLFFPVFFGITVFGPDLLANQVYATYTLAKKLEIPHVFERIEVILAIIWLLTIYYKVQICYFVLIRCVKFLFSLEDEKKILLPVGWTLFGSSMELADTNVYFFTFNAAIWPLYAMTFGLALPILIYFVSSFKAMITQKRGMQQNDKN
ncbi:MAG: endospore germination permease, partial [Bacillota bacterium]|nr:endospore germination permease [Bacillota bacterium]